MNGNTATVAQVARHKHPPSVNYCDDFALGMVALTLAVTVLFVKKWLNKA